MACVFIQALTLFIFAGYGSFWTYYIIFLFRTGFFIK